MRPTLIAVPAALMSMLTSALAAAPPQEPGKSGAALTPSARFEALKQQHADAQAEFEKLYEAATTDEQRQKIANEKYPKRDDFVPRAIAIVKGTPKDPVAVDVMLWALELGPIRDAAAAPLYDAVLAHHLADPKLVLVCRALQFQMGESSENFLRRLFVECKDKEARGNAGYFLAKAMSSRAQIARQLQTSKNQETAAQFEEYFGADWVAAARKADVAAIDKGAEVLLERIVSEFADVAATRGKLGEAAARDLFEIRNLAVGKKAPEIEGTDVDGVPFKLSDYRGKVLFLDFWGFW